MKGGEEGEGGGVRECRGCDAVMGDRERKRENEDIPCITG